MRKSLALVVLALVCVAGLPVGTAKCYAHRGRARLRARLDEAVA